MLQDWICAGFSSGAARSIAWMDLLHAYGMPVTKEIELDDELGTMQTKILPSWQQFGHLRPLVAMDGLRLYDNTIFLFGPWSLG